MSHLWIAYTDGASRGNPGPAGCGAYILAPDATPHEAYLRLDDCTNNVAEYRALLLALDELAKLKAQAIEIRADSELMIKQLKGIYRVKHPNIIPLFQAAQEKLRQFTQKTFVHVPREQNREADALANRAIDTLSCTSK